MSTQTSRVSGLRSWVTKPFEMYLPSSLLCFSWLCGREVVLGARHRSELNHLTHRRSRELHESDRHTKRAASATKRPLERILTEILGQDRSENRNDSHQQIGTTSISSFLFHNHQHNNNFFTTTFSTTSSLRAKPAQNQQQQQGRRHSPAFTNFEEIHHKSTSTADHTSKQQQQQQQQHITMNINTDILTSAKSIDSVAATVSTIEVSSSDDRSSDASSISSHDESSSSSSPSWLKDTIVEPHVGFKKVLVTGGAGFIGSSVAEHLLNRGDDVVLVDEVNDYYDVTIKERNWDRLVELFGTDRVKVYRGDICDEPFMTDLFERERPAWICHMAARAGVRPSIQDPYVYIHSNIKGTTHLMELAHKYGVENFVFASSSSVYGGSKSTFFSEDEVVDHPVSPYAASKKACELLAYTYHHLYKLNVTGLRFFTVYGPRGRPDMAPFKFIDRVSRGEQIQQFGDGSSSRDYTYVDDIVDGVVRSLDRPYPYQIFNLGKGSGTSLKEFIDLVQHHTGRKANIKVMPDQPGDVPYTCADVRKAQHLLGYTSTVSFDEGIRRTVEWYRGQYGIEAEAPTQAPTPTPMPASMPFRSSSAAVVSPTI